MKKKSQKLSLHKCTISKLNSLKNIRGGNLTINPFGHLNNTTGFHTLGCNTSEGDTLTVTVTEAEVEEHPINITFTAQGNFLTN